MERLFFSNGGPLGQLLEVRRKCDPEIKFMLKGLHVGDNNPTENIANYMLEDIGLQYDDMILGVEEGETPPADTFIEIRMLRQEIPYKKIDQLVEYMKDNYPVIEVTIMASREERDLL